MPAQDQSIKQALAFEKQRQQGLLTGDVGAVLASYQNQQVFLPDTNNGRFWDERFQAEDLEQNFNYQFPLEQWRVEQVLQLLDKKKSVLNLGVGSGRLEARLLRQLPADQYLGTDITNKRLKLLQKKWPNYKFVKADLLKLPLADASFEQVCLLEVLEHIRPDKTFKVLAEIQRVLKPAGQLLISVPLNEGLETMLPDNPNSHLRLYSPELLQFELEQAGFRVKKVYLASAFAKHFKIKHLINQLFKLRQANNCLVIAQKV